MKLFYFPFALSLSKCEQPVPGMFYFGTRNGALDSCIVRP
jgi:hypothetical protein